MAENTVGVRFVADTSQYTPKVAQAAAVTTGLGASAAATSRPMAAASAGFGKMGKALAGVTAGFTAVAAGKAALGLVLDYDSAFVGVTKTVEGTEEQLAGLRQGILDMSKELPTSASEIAGVAEAAGQLGIATDNVLGFSRTMVDLGETTNLTAEQAATALARFANITQLPQDQFENLGSTIVELGNNYATTEAEITEMAVRLAAAGALAGFTEAEMLGLSAAATSVGVQAEAGGSALSRVMTDINSAVLGGTADMESFAETSNMTGEEFAALWKADPAQALNAFIMGLGDMVENNEDASGALDEVGLAGIRTSRTLLSLATTGGLLGEAFDDANGAFDANTALAAEAEKRYESAAAQIAIFGNNLKAFVIETGQKALPAIVDAVKAIGQAWQDLLPILAEVAGFVGPIVEQVVDALWEWWEIQVDLAVAIAKMFGPAAVVAFAVALTAIGEIAEVLGNVVEWVNENEVAMQALAIVLGGALAVAAAQAALAVGSFVVASAGMAAVNMAVRLGNIAQAFHAVKAAAVTAGAATSIAFAGATAGVGLALGLVVKSFMDASAARKDYADDVKAVGEAMKTEDGQIISLVGSWEDLTEAQLGAVESLEKYMEEESRFAGSNQLDDLERMGLGLDDVTYMLNQGAEGWRQFLEAANRTGEIDVDASQMEALVAAWDEGPAAVEKLLNPLYSFNSVTGKNVDVVRSFVRESQVNLDAVRNTTLGYISQAEALGLLTPAQADAARETAYASTSYLELTGVSEKYAGQLANLASLEGEASEGRRYGGEASRSAAGDLDELGDSLDEVRNSFAEAAAAASTFDSVLTELRAPDRSFFDAQIALAEAEFAAWAKINDPEYQPGGVNILTQEGRDNLRELASLADAGTGFTQSLYVDTGGDSIAAFESLVRNREVIIEVAVSMGATPEDIDRIVDDLGLTDREFRIAINLAEAGKTDEEIRALLDGPLSDLEEYDVQVGIDTDVAQALADIEEVSRDLDDVDGTEGSVFIDGVSDQFEETRDEVLADLNALRSELGLPRIGADDAEFKAVETAILDAMKELGQEEAFASLSADDQATAVLERALELLGAIDTAPTSTGSVVINTRWTHTTDPVPRFNDVVGLDAYQTQVTQAVLPGRILDDSSYAPVGRAAGGIGVTGRAEIGREPTYLYAEAGVPEAFIPINGSQRSDALLTQTAAMMGKQVIPMREGDVVYGGESLLTGFQPDANLAGGATGLNFGGRTTTESRAGSEIVRSGGSVNIDRNIYYGRSATVDEFGYPNQGSLRDLSRLVAAVNNVSASLLMADAVNMAAWGYTIGEASIAAKILEDGAIGITRNKTYFGRDGQEGSISELAAFTAGLSGGSADTRPYSGSSGYLAAIDLIRIGQGPELEEDGSPVTTYFGWTREDWEAVSTIPYPPVQPDFDPSAPFVNPGGEDGPVNEPGEWFNQEAYDRAYEAYERAVEFFNEAQASARPLTSGGLFRDQAIASRLGLGPGAMFTPGEEQFFPFLRQAWVMPDGSVMMPNGVIIPRPVAPDRDYYTEEVEPEPQYIAPTYEPPPPYVPPTWTPPPPIEPDPPTGSPADPWDDIYDPFRYHLVKQGETLGQIGQRYGVPWEVLVDINNQTPYVEKIIPGQGIDHLVGDTILVDGVEPRITRHYVDNSEQLGEIAAEHGTSWQYLLWLNNFYRPGIITAGEGIDHLRGQPIWVPTPGNGGAIVADAPYQAPTYGGLTNEEWALIGDPEQQQNPALDPSPLLLHRVSSQDTLGGIASRYGTTWEELVALNNKIPYVEKITPGEGISHLIGDQIVVGGPGAPDDGIGHHTVNSTESLGQIASKYGTTWQWLLWLNNYFRPGSIIEGQGIEHLRGQQIVVPMALGGLVEDGMITQTPRFAMFGEAGPEAYIPLNGSTRSAAILEQAAEALGMQVSPIASGSVSGGPVGPGPVKQVIDERKLADALATAVGKSIRENPPEVTVELDGRSVAKNQQGHLRQLARASA